MTDGQREILENLSKSRTAPQREVTRAKALLYAGEGLANTAIAARLEVSPASVVAWRSRFGEEGVAKLGRVRPGRGRKASIPAEKVDKIVRATLHDKPAGETHWSCRSMAKAQGVSPATVQRVWSARGLQPHRVETFKLSNDKRFEEKLVDVVGLYLNPPDKAVVLCMDEKSQIQALDRTQATLPMKKGRAGTMTHDYKRNGTTTLFAALDTLQGRVVGECHERHRHQEFLKFLRRLNTEFPGDVPLHLVMDNYGTHKHAKVQSWLKRNPRFVPHFVPTSSSWMNLVERWFGHLDKKAIRRGVFLSVADLKTSIEAFLKAWNQDPKPFVWTATVESIQEKLTRCRRTLEQIQPGCTSPKYRKRKR